MSEETETKTKMLQGILIDPYKQEVSQIAISHDTDVWRKVLRCDYFDCMCISSESVTGTCMDLWFDDEGRMTETPSPRFRMNRGDSVGGGNYDFCGYGLIFSSNKNGETIGLETSPASLAMFMAMSCLQFEDFENANNPRFKGVDTDFLEQKMRIIELELPGQFQLLGTATMELVQGQPTLLDQLIASTPQDILKKIVDALTDDDEEKEEEK